MQFSTRLLLAITAFSALTVFGIRRWPVATCSTLLLMSLPVLVGLIIFRVLPNVRRVALIGLLPTALMLYVGLFGPLAALAGFQQANGFDDARLTTVQIVGKLYPWADNRFFPIELIRPLYVYGNEWRKFGESFPAVFAWSMMGTTDNYGMFRSYLPGCYAMHCFSMAARQGLPVTDRWS